MRATYDSVVDGAPSVDRLVELWLASLQERLGGVRLFDAHTHVDRADPDGSCFGADELRGALEVADARAVVFPLAEPGSFFVAAAIARTPGVPLPEGAA